jgi:hypothetical protein
MLQKALAPGIFVRREHGERRACARAHGVAVENDLVFVQAQLDAQRCERAGHGLVARLGGGFVVAVRVHGAHG